MTSVTRTLARGGSGLGSALSSAGDLNGDGFDDLVMGAWEWSDGQTQEGGVFVYYGGTTLSAEPDWQFESDQANAELGRSVAHVGDLNGDGYADLVVAAPRFDSGQNDEGRLWAYYGGPDGLGETWDWRYEPDLLSGRVGNLIADAGDLDLDGYADLVVRRNGNDGAEAAVFRGSADGLGVTPDFTRTVPDNVFCVADMNGDGYAPARERLGSARRSERRRLRGRALGLERWVLRHQRGAHGARGRQRSDSGDRGGARR